MNARSIGWTPALVAALAVAAFAGERSKCTTNTQDCLDKLAAKLETRGWVGLELDQHETTGALTVRRVVPESPAVKAGFRVGDRLVALEGVRFADRDEAAMLELDRRMVSGNRVTYTIVRDTVEREIEVELGSPPEDVLAQWIGRHMLQHVTVARSRH